MMNETTLGELAERENGPMHEWFGLSYAAYLVLNRSAIQAMPVRWQKRLRALLDELRETFDTEQMVSSYRITALDGNRFTRDPFRDYRRGPRPPFRNGVKS